METTKTLKASIKIINNNDHDTSSNQNDQNWLRFICIVCPKSCEIDIQVDKNHHMTDIKGAGCKRGKEYVQKELVSPSRVFTSLIKVKNSSVRMCPVRTDIPIAKDLLIPLAKSLANVELSAPIQQGTILVENIGGTTAKLIATREIKKSDK
ncbi:MAG: DUF1667 domain-containing protein [Oligoflexia bacterium]|nr:DUF1667 domain-containing protein [Oligoflexia bacterium]